MEFKIIVRRKYVCLIFALLLILSGVLGYFGGIHQETYAEGSKVLSGRQALAKINKEYSSTRFLTADRLNQILTYYKRSCSAGDPDEAFLKTDQKYPDVIELIGQVYFPDSTNSETDVLKLSDVSDFYKKRQSTIWNRVRKSLGIYNYNHDDYIYVSDTAGNMDVPIRYGNSSEWKTYFRITSVLSVLLALASILISSEIFSNDRDRQMDLVLCTVSRRKQIEFVLKRIAGACITVSVMLALTLTVFSLFFWQSLKLTSLHSQLQLVYPLSIYNISIGQAVMLEIIGSWTGLMAVTVSSVCFNLLLQTNVRTIILSGLIFIIPEVLLFIPGLPSNIAHFLMIQPGNFLLAERVDKSLFAYRIAEFLVPTYITGLLNAFFYMVTGCVISVAFVKQRTKKRGF